MQSHTQNTSALESCAIRESMMEEMPVPLLRISPQSEDRPDRTTTREILYSTKTTRLNNLMINITLDPVSCLVSLEDESYALSQSSSQAHEI